MSVGSTGQYITQILIIRDRNVPHLRVIDRPGYSFNSNMNSNCHDYCAVHISSAMAGVVLFLLTDVTTTQMDAGVNLECVVRVCVWRGIIIISTNCNIVGSIYGCVGKGA